MKHILLAFILTCELSRSWGSFDLYHCTGGEFEKAGILYDGYEARIVMEKRPFAVPEYYDPNGVLIEFEEWRRIYLK